jgi:hypothetical protein
MSTEKFKQLLANLEFVVGGEPSEWYAEREKLIDYVEELDVWSRFAGYLLDHCEGETIYEESLQYWLSEMLRKEKDAAAKLDGK